MLAGEPQHTRLGGAHTELGGALDHFAHDFRHDGLSLVGSLLHLLVANLNGIVEAAQVGDDADAEGLDAAVVSHDDLRHGGHADGVAAEGAIHAVFCGSLEGRTSHADVHAVNQTNLPFLGNLCGEIDEFVVVGFVHVREAWTGGEVLAAQGMLGEEIDVVGDDHEVANLECGVHAACSVGDEERLDAQFVHDTNGERHLLHVVSLVVVESALHGHDVDAPEFAEDELAAMSFDGRYGEVGDFAIGELERVSYFGS